MEKPLQVGLVGKIESTSKCSNRVVSEGRKVRVMKPW